MAKKKDRYPVSGEINQGLGDAFGGLSSVDFPSGPKGPVEVHDLGVPSATEPKKRNRGRVDVIRQKAGRGGKTVTVASGFKGISEKELQQMARELRQSCGVGGTLKGRIIEIQGEKRDEVFAFLERAGFRPVRAGG
ncbi:MAG: translation initiation factor [Opitutaceae bacterium]|nr:translation initiation factor [Opitutaceae bacterium]